MIYLHACWEVTLAFAPWLLLGAAVSGVLHVMLPESWIRDRFQGRGGVLRSVLLGVPLPLCSCGVIPAGVELRQQGASRGSTVAFLISTPQTGVDSVLVSASMLGWPFALFKVGSAALTGWAGGTLADVLEPEDASSSSDSSSSAHASSSEKSWSEGLQHALQLLRSIWGWLLVGILVSAALSTWLPAGSLAVGGEGSLWPLLMALVLSLPLYVCATASVPIAAELVAGGLPTGAALVFLMAGPATNLATLGAIHSSLGRRSLMAYLGSIVLGSLVLGWAFDFVLEASVIGGHGEHLHSEGLWEQISGLILAVLLLGFALERARQIWRERMAAREEADWMTLPVQGMTCQGCVGRLEKVLRRAEGVEEVLIQLNPGQARVKGGISGARMRELIEGAGFEVPA